MEINDPTYGSEGYLFLFLFLGEVLNCDSWYYSAFIVIFKRQMSRRNQNDLEDSMEEAIESQ